MAAADDIKRVFREFRRYTGDGLPGAPVNAPLPVGDPQSGVHSPKKADVRQAFVGMADRLEEGIVTVEGAIPTIEAARDEALADVAASTGAAEDARDLAIQAADQAAVVGAGDVPTYPSRALAAASNVPVARTYIMTAGYAAPGDGGAATYKRLGSAPGTPKAWHFQSANGTWWELTERQPNILMFGAVGNDSDASAAANTAAIQAVLDYAAAFGLPAGFVPYGTFRSSTIQHPSGVMLEGRGPGSVIKAVPTLAHNASLIIRFAVGSNMGLRNLRIDGNNVGANTSQVRFTELVSYTYIDGLTLENVQIVNSQYMGCAIGDDCKNVRVVGCTFSNHGFSNASANAGVGLWISSATTPNSPQDVLVEGCTFRDNRWSAMHLCARRARVLGNTFVNNKEAHIFAPRLLPNLVCEDVVIDGNVFDTVTKHDISSHAIETGAYRLAITNNVIRNCDHGGIALTDTRHTLVEGNQISNFNKLKFSVPGLQTSGVDIISTAAAPNQPNNIVIRNNMIFDDQGAPTGHAAVSVAGSGSIPVEISIQDNQCNFNPWGAGKAINIQSSFGATETITQRNNRGALDADPRVGSFQAPAAPGNYAVSGAGFRPRMVRITATYLNGSVMEQSTAIIVADGSADCHATFAGGGTGYGANMGNYAVHLINAAGTGVCVATFSAFNADGFTLNFTNVTHRAYIRWEAYP